MTGAYPNPQPQVPPNLSPPPQPSYPQSPYPNQPSTPAVSEGFNFTWIIVGIVILILIGGGIFAFVKLRNRDTTPDTTPPATNQSQQQDQQQDTTPDQTSGSEFEDITCGEIMSASLIEPLFEGSLTYISENTKPIYDDYLSCKFNIYIDEFSPAAASADFTITKDPTEDKYTNAINAVKSVAGDDLVEETTDNIGTKSTELSGTIAVPNRNQIVFITSNNKYLISGYIAGDEASMEKTRTLANQINDVLGTGESIDLPPATQPDTTPPATGDATANLCSNSEYSTINNSEAVTYHKCGAGYISLDKESYEKLRDKFTAEPFGSADHIISEISDLTCLECLDIGLYFAGLEDISSLSSLTNLKELWIHDTAVSDVSPLSGLENLETLRLQRTPASDDCDAVKGTLPDVLYVWC